jgi:hypothetical protein
MIAVNIAAAFLVSSSMTPEVVSSRRQLVKFLWCVELRLVRLLLRRRLLLHMTAIVATTARLEDMAVVTLLIIAIDMATTRLEQSGALFTRYGAWKMKPFAQECIQFQEVENWLATFRHYVDTFREE